MPGSRLLLLHGSRAAATQRGNKRPLKIYMSQQSVKLHLVPNPSRAHKHLKIWNCLFAPAQKAAALKST